MTRLLIGIHDREGIAIAPVGSWVLDTVSLAANEGPVDFARLAPGRQIITRLNFGYGSTGTIPTPDRYEAFAAQCANYVQNSNACARWIIGNEPNLTSVEAPNGQPIGPIDYARCFSLCRQAIRRVQPNAEIIPAPIAPWSVEAGDWLIYWQDMLVEINTRGGFDAIALHSYIHGNDPGLVNSDARMDAPYSDRSFQFNAYRDTLSVPALRGFEHLPAYLTEACPVDVSGWEARGIMPAMLGNVFGWNTLPGKQKIQCCVFYRFPLYDKWGFADKPAVIAEFHAAAPHYRSPEPAQPQSLAPGPSVPVPPAPPTSPPTSPPTPPLSRQWDKRLDVRGVKIETPAAMPGDMVWRVTEAVWLDEQQAGGRHHLFVDIRDTDGSRLTNIPLRVSWPTGSARIVTEAKPGELWAANYPMSPSKNEFSIRVDEGGFASETVTGIGMGADTPGGFNPGIHTSTGLVFQRVPVPAVQPIPPMPMPPPETNPVQPVTVPRLVHPVENPAYRRVTQIFGVNPQRYAQWGLDGHNGIDFGTPTGARIRAVADGVAVEVLNNATGYGLYIKLRHPWGESLYGHLSQQLVTQGATVRAGEVIGLSGNTGNSTGPHLHLGLRINPYQRGRPFDGYSDPAPYLANTVEPGQPVQPQSAGDVREIIRQAAREFVIDENLLLSLAWAESSFRPNARSSAGAMGLFQVMPATWEEWRVRVGALDPFNARDNAKVGSAYLKWLLTQTVDVHRALWAYNFGIGNIQAGRTPPAQTIEFANKVLHGRDLLNAVMRGAS